MLNLLTYLGQRGISYLQSLGHFVLFLQQLLLRNPNFSTMWLVIRRQFYFVGVLSCLIIMVSALFVGMVIALQGYNTLQKFGASAYLGQLLALSLSRELGPVLSALLFAGRACSALTAEIGVMKTTEQLASMDMMGVDPLEKIIYPRFIAGLVCLPMLSLIFIVVAIYGGYLVGVVCLGVDAGIFWANMQSAINFRLDIVSGVIKSIIFAFVEVWIAVYQGMHCIPTAEGISQATTQTVVYSSLAILGLDFVLTAMMIGGW